MKKKCIATTILLLCCTLFGACRKVEPPLDSRAAETALLSQVNDDLDKIGKGCSLFSVSNDDGSVYVSLCSDGGNNFGQKCQIIYNAVHNYPDKRLHAYKIDVTEIISESNKQLISWDSDGFYFNTMDFNSPISDGNCTLEDVVALDASLTEPTASNESDTTNELSSESVNPDSSLSDNEYLDMLKEYGGIFTDELSILSDNKISQLIRDNSNVDSLMSELSYVLSEVRNSSATLQEYYEQFDQNRNAPPMGTKIMTLLSYAQSALTQYDIALSHLQSYFSSHDQNDIDAFTKYAEKAADSLNSYENLLHSETALHQK